MAKHFRVGIPQEVDFDPVGWASSGKWSRIASIGGWVAGCLASWAAIFFVIKLLFT
jgi:hypothetical protein